MRWGSENPDAPGGDVIEILREAHQATVEAQARGGPVADAELLAKLRLHHDEAVAFGTTHTGTYLPASG